MKMLGSKIAMNAIIFMRTGRNWKTSLPKTRVVRIAMMKKASIKNRA
jgi:hypothetical protein